MKLFGWFGRAAAAATLIFFGVLSTAPALAGSGHTLFLRSATENADFTAATLPIFRGTSHGQPVWYVVTESSDENDAQARGVNFSERLANAIGTAAVQKVQIVDGTVAFPATVRFGLSRQVVAGPSGFPPAVAIPGAVGEPGYSPLIELPNGTVLNASHVANASGKADKVLALDTVARTVKYAETPGFYAGKAVHYLSFEASNPVAAALEDVTFAPALNAAPGQGSQADSSARAKLIAFTNGQTGAANPQRQGLSSAVLDGLSPLNILKAVPDGSDYSPLWDVHLAQWTQDAVANGLNLRQTDTVDDLVQEGLVTAPSGASFGASGFIVNCPIVSLDD